MKPYQKFIIALLCFFSVLLHLWFHSDFGFHRDELLYLSLTNHLDLGYASVPPMISWLAAITIKCFGPTPLGVKVLPAICSGLLLYLSTRICKEMGGGFFAQVLTIVAMLCTPLILRAYLLFQPVPFDIFFWTLTYYSIIKYINTSENKWLSIVGLVTGLSLLNKYLILLLLAGVIVVLPFTKWKNLFVKRAFYIAMGIALVVVAPNIYWQVSNGFPLLTHMAELRESQLQHVSNLTFFVDQLMMLHTSVLVALIGFASMLFWKPLAEYRLLTHTIVFVFISLLLMDGKGYYAAGVYPLLIAAGSISIAHYMKSIWSRVCLLIAICILILPLLPQGIPLMPAPQMAAYFDQLEEHGFDVGRVHEDGEEHTLPQDYADMLGWAQITEFAAEGYSEVEDKEACLIIGENYGLAGAVSILGQQYDLPEAVSFSDTYRYWVPRSFDKEVTSVIFIDEQIWPGLRALFVDIKVVGIVDNIHSRQHGTKVYLLQNPRKPFSEYWADVLKEVFGE